MRTLLEKAIVLAAEAHEGMGQVRKSDGTPYIFHPLGVARRVAEAGCLDSEVLAAAVLHDVLEDTGVTAELLVDMFGQNIATLVSHVTEKKEGNWFARKSATLLKIKEWPKQARIIKAADALDNLNCTKRQLRLAEAEVENTASVWQKFGRGREWQYWYTRGIFREILIETTPSFDPERLLVAEGLDLVREVWPDWGDQEKWLQLDREAVKHAKSSGAQ